MASQCSTVPKIIINKKRRGGKLRVACNRYEWYQSSVWPAILWERRIRKAVVALATHKKQDHTSLLPFRLVLVENGTRGEQKRIISKAKLMLIASSSRTRHGHNADI